MTDFRYAIGAPLKPHSAPSFTLFTLDASTDALEYIFQAQEDATITRVGFRQGTLTGTAPTFRVSLQGVDGSGNPDGAILSSGNAYGDYTPGGGSNSTWQWVTLTNSVAVTRGQVLALVIKQQSGTIDGSNNCSFTSHLLGVERQQVQNFPYSIQNNAGSRTRQSSPPIFGYGSASTAYGFPMEATNSFTVQSTATPDEFAIYFTLPSGYGNTFSVLGVEFAVLFSTAAKTARLTLYDTDGTTPLQSVDFDTDLTTNVGATGVATVFFDESALATLNFGSAYRLSFTIIDATGSYFIRYLEVDAAADWDAYPGGQNFAVSTQTNGGGWTDNAVRRIVANLIVADWTEPAGGSAGGYIY